MNPWGSGVAQEVILKYLLCCNENSHLQHCLPIELLYEVTKLMDAKVVHLYICTFAFGSIYFEDPRVGVHVPHKSQGTYWFSMNSLFQHYFLLSQSKYSPTTISQYIIYQMYLIVIIRGITTVFSHLFLPF